MMQVLGGGSRKSIQCISTHNRTRGLYLLQQNRVDDGDF
jgi:hypothetical protein